MVLTSESFQIEPTPKHRFFTGCCDCVILPYSIQTQLTNLNVLFETESFEATLSADPVQVGCDNSECGFWIHADCDNISPERLKVCGFSWLLGLGSPVSGKFLRPALTLGAT
jgi:hypothetical protein